MRYDFDEIIDRKNTNSENVEGFRSYMFSDEPDIELPVPDDELIRMWVADMEFAVAPGSNPCALATRFCTLTAAISGSVPCLK